VHFKESIIVRVVFYASIFNEKVLFPSINVRASKTLTYERKKVY
jgi:hypothetical protein